jgi:hypothetical protein
VKIVGGGYPSSVTFYNDSNLFITHYTVGVYLYTHNGFNLSQKNLIYSSTSHYSLTMIGGSNSINKMYAFASDAVYQGVYQVHYF